MRVPNTVTEPPKAGGLFVKLCTVLLFSGAAAGGLYYAHREDQLLEGFYVVLGVCFVLGLMASWRSFHELTREGGLQKNLFAALDCGDLVMGVEDHKSDSVTRRVLLSMVTQWKRGGQKAVNVQPDAFLNAMRRQLSRHARFIESSGATCLNIGFLGTLAGMTDLLSRLAIFAAEGKLASQEGGPDVFAALFGAGGPASGLAVAFVTSLVGGALKQVLFKLSAALRLHADRLTDYCADAIARDFGPSLQGRAE